MAILLLSCIKSHGLGGILVFKEVAAYPQIISYPLWHIFVLLLRELFFAVVPHVGENQILMYANAAVNAGSVAVVVPIIGIFFKDLLKIRWQAAVLAIISGLLLFTGPLDASPLLGTYYLGAYPGNIWHNPTFLLMRPLALLTVLLYFKIFSEKKDTLKYLLWAAICMALSALCKPSFFQAFLPGLVLYCVIFFLWKRNKETFLFCLKIAASCVPVGVIAILQFVIGLTGNATEGGIGFAPFYVWMYFTSNVPLSLLVSIAFPLLVAVLLVIRKTWDTNVLLILCMFVSALLQYSLLYIKAGPFAADFCWGLELSIFFCFMVGIKALWKETVKIREVKGRITAFPIICWIVFILHVLFGIEYFINIWETGFYRAPLQYFG